MGARLPRFAERSVYNRRAAHSVDASFCEAREQAVALQTSRIPAAKRSHKLTWSSTFVCRHTSERVLEGTVKEKPVIRRIGSKANRHGEADHELGVVRQIKGVARAG